MIDAVASWHLNPETCGVAKWNHALAKRLGVPCWHLSDTYRGHTLISIKTAEINGEYGPWYHHLPLWASHDVFLHDAPTIGEGYLCGAQRVYAANPAIAAAVRIVRPDVITAFCPPTVDGNPTRGAYRVLTFGMASKIRDVLPHFQNLKEELDRDHPDYTLSLSTAVHEGSPWDTTLTESIEAMRAIFGDKLRVLGYLADDALAKELQDCDAVAAYFVPALRANNTSAWAALAAGKFLYTNLDAQSPALDPAAYSWEKLLDVLA